jgi:hypothetical protein
MRFENIKILVLLWITLCANYSYSYTNDCLPVKNGKCYLTTADRNDIENAIVAAADGDTIRIAPGTINFNKTIILTKALSIIGAGIDSTVINDQATPNGIFQLEGPGFIRVSGFTLTGQGGSYNGSVRISANNKRIDSVRFNQFNDRHAIGVYGNLSDVVIDKCVFEAGGRGINIFGNSNYWSDTQQYRPGTSYGVYIEDCIFKASGVEVVDLNFGGAYIVRKCKILNGGNLNVHGADSGNRSGGYIEVYNNEFINSGTKKDMTVIMRGGTALIHNNKILGPYNSAFKIQYWRSCYGAGSERQPFDNSNANRCQNNSSNTLDGNFSPIYNGWPCKDQPGTGANHSLKPMYEWNNAWDQGIAQLVLGDVWGCKNPSMADHVMLGRDYFNGTQKNGYTPYKYPHPLTTYDSDRINPPQNLRILE